MHPLYPISTPDLDSKVIDGPGQDDDIIAQCGNDTVQRASMQTLKPCIWLNDQIIHFFFKMLAKRDSELCKNDEAHQKTFSINLFLLPK